MDKYFFITYTWNYKTRTLGDLSSAFDSIVVNAKDIADAILEQYEENSHYGSSFAVTFYSEITKEEYEKLCKIL